MIRTLIAVLVLGAAISTACGSATPYAATVTPAVTVVIGSATADSGTAVPAPTGSVSPAPTSTAPATATPAATPTPPPAGSTGIVGLVTVGPTCPVERPDSPCPDRPLAARITIWRGNTQVAETRSGDDGRFLVILAPGDYRLVGETEGTFPRGSEVEATVTSGRLTSVQIRYDSGIR